MSKMKPSVVNFDGERWYYRKRELVGFTVKYGKVSGFSSKEEACAARDASDAAFQAQLTQLYGKHPEDVLFVDFMIFWVYRVYFPTVSYATQSIYDYVVHSYILQISDSAMKLLSVSTKIINDMLVRASKRSNTAAEKVREVLNSVFNGAIVSPAPLLYFCMMFQLVARHVDVSLKVNIFPIPTENTNNFIKANLQYI